jgi:hypothetical protein
MMLASCGVLGGPASVLAQQVAVPALTIGRAADGKRAVIDGRVDHDAWAAAEPFSAFIQQDPNEESPATELTEIKVLLDEQNLYIGVVCFDSERGNILVGQSRRDADLVDTGSIRVLLDTFNDGQNEPPGLDDFLERAAGTAGPPRDGLLCCLQRQPRHFGPSRPTRCSVALLSSSTPACSTFGLNAYPNARAFVDY